LPKTSRPVPTNAGRQDAVFIRKSGKQQEDAAQIENVKTMLASKGIEVPESTWFVCTVGRRKVSKNPTFLQLIELVEANKIRTVYIEDQKRWGTRNSPELFKYIAKFREHKCQLFDLRYGRNLAADDVFSEIMAVVNSHASKQELKDIAFRPLRSKVNNFKMRGSWPTGTQPFGFGKRCYDIDGKTLLWEWHPVSRTKGQQFFVDRNGKLQPGQEDIKLPRKERGQIIKLVPSRNKSHVKAIQLMFELFVREGLSYRQIAIRLNDTGYRYYGGKRFTFNYVNEFLRNPAYVGDTHYGKVVSGELCSFDSSGEMVELPESESDDPVRAVKRSEKDRIVGKDTHEGLIDRKTWKLAKARSAEISKRTSYAPSNAEYYLRPILVCGHCGKNMTGGREGKGDEQIVTYFCSTYRSGKSNAENVRCGAHRIRHDVAEGMLFDKLKELNVDYKRLTSTVTRRNAEDRLSEIERRDMDNDAVEYKLIREGIKALQAYYKENYEASEKGMRRFETASRMQYQMWKIDRTLFTKRFREIVRKAENDYVERATRRVVALERNFERYTMSWALADEQQKQILQRECDRLRDKLAVWKPRTLPITERLKAVRQVAKELGDQYSALLKEWPSMGKREQGESLRRIFKAVRLYWKPTFHPNVDNPSRERTTSRTGRFSYKLLENKIEWDFADGELLRAT